MLPDPPCIEGLLGCTDGGYNSGASAGGSGGGSSGTTSSTSSSSYSTSSGFGSGGSGGFSSSSSTRSTSFANFLRGSSSSSSSSPSSSVGSSSRTSLSGFLQGTSSNAQRIAQYTLSAVNRGAENLKNVVLSHGPLPSGAVFDSSRSSQGCVQVGTSVECTTDLSAGQSKEFTLAYQVQNSISCALARALQTAKTKINGITGSADTGVSTSVTCQMNSDQGAQSSASSTSLDTMPVGAFGGSGSTVTTSVFGTGGSMPGMIVGGEQDLGSEKSGYKGYKPVSIPRTGAANIFSQETAQYVLTPKNDAGVTAPSETMFWAAFFLVLIISIFGLFVKKRIFG